MYLYYLFYCSIIIFITVYYVTVYYVILCWFFCILYYFILHYIILEYIILNYTIRLNAWYIPDWQQEIEVWKEANTLGGGVRFKWSKLLFNIHNQVSLSKNNQKTSHDMVWIEAWFYLFGKPSISIPGGSTVCGKLNLYSVLVAIVLVLVIITRSTYWYDPEISRGRGWIHRSNTGLSSWSVSCTGLVKQLFFTVL